MDTRKYMVLIKGRIKTSEIKLCQYQSGEERWRVTFYGGETYSYSPSNVIYMKDPAIINPRMYRISRRERVFFGIEAVYIFKNGRNSYWHICFEDGQERDYKQSELKITESCFNQKQAGNVFEYLKQIAELSELRNEITGEKLLAKKYKKIDFVGEDTALAKYLNPKAILFEEKIESFIPIFPFGCNNSQYRAVKSAMEKQISVIQGPPGTGKTQTILNIIANILLQGKTVQVVSNNNAATENVYEKMNSVENNLGFLIAALGSSKNKEKFLAGQCGSYPDFSDWKLSENVEVSLKEVREQSFFLQKMFDKQEELAQLKQEQSQLETEFQYFVQYLEKMDISDSINPKREISSESWLSLWQECLRSFEFKQKIGLLFKIKSFFRYGLTNFRFYQQDMAKIIANFQSGYYQAREKELSERIDEIERELEIADSFSAKALQHQSMAVLKDRLAVKYSAREGRRIFGEEDLWKNSSDVLEEYPIILSTTFSARSSLSSETIYDYLIMDEASQVDIATGALALSCAKNVVIVGDTKQLPNVMTEDIKKRSESIFHTFDIAEGYLFTKSFLQSVLDVMPEVTQTLLREHYRCHPKIINFCNQKFYRGELLVMTEDHGEKDVLGVVKTVPGNHVRNHYSQRQIDVIKSEIIPRYVTNREETGIIAPYKNQVKALEKEFQDIDVATVHKFQGREKDTIIISTVDDEITDFVDDPYLINVAVSRAKKKLLLVVTGNKQMRERNLTDLIDYIQYHNFEVSESRIYSVFDYLYQQYTEERIAYLQKHKKISAFDSENLMYALLEEILAADIFSHLDLRCHFPLHMLIKDTELLDGEESRFAMHPAAHVDFLLYNRISKKPVLAIEVDGYAYHKRGTDQSRRDAMKDHILKLYEIPSLRFRTNGSGEKQKIEKRLKELCS